MTINELTRELGKAIQADERYAAYKAAVEANDADTGLNELMGKMQLLQLSYQQEAQGNADEAKLEQYNNEFTALYNEIMLNENMKKFEEAKQNLDDMMNYIVQFLSMCVNGADPETCDPTAQQADCTGSCSTCGGCG